MWPIAFINELLTILEQHHRCLGEARSRADRWGRCASRSADCCLVTRYS